MCQEGIEQRSEVAHCYSKGERERPILKVSSWLDLASFGHHVLSIQSPCLLIEFIWLGLALQNIDSLPEEKGEKEKVLIEHEQKIGPQWMDRGLNRGPPDLGGKNKSFGPLGLLLDLSNDGRRNDPPSTHLGWKLDLRLHGCDTTGQGQSPKSGETLSVGDALDHAAISTTKESGLGGCT